MEEQLNEQIKSLMLKHDNATDDLELKALLLSCYHGAMSFEQDCIKEGCDKIEAKEEAIRNKKELVNMLEDTLNTLNTVAGVKATGEKIKKL